jgi:opine dehydrogenase
MEVLYMAGKPNLKIVTVVGAGNGGRAFAAYLASRGFSVNLLLQTVEHSYTIWETNSIYSEGELEGEFNLNMVTSDPQEAIRDSLIVIVVTPASSHKTVTCNILPWLKSGQIILLNPGRTWGAIEVYQMIKKFRPKLRVCVGETQTLLFTCRKIADYGVKISKIKEEIQCCFYPEYVNDIVKSLILNVFPMFNFVDNINITSLNNIGALVHPAISILNSGSICRKTPFKFYQNGVNDHIVRVIEEIDKERLAVLNALGVSTLSYLEWAKQVYGVDAESYLEAFHGVECYREIGSPSSLELRYITEDVPTGLVPLASLAEYLRIDTPTINSVITLAGLLVNMDFWAEGRTIESLNLSLEMLFPESHSEELDFNAASSYLKFMNMAE